MRLGEECEEATVVFEEVDEQVADEEEEGGRKQVFPEAGVH